jgi:hypothetical protein
MAASKVDVKVIAVAAQQSLAVVIALVSIAPARSVARTCYAPLVGQPIGSNRECYWRLAGRDTDPVRLSGTILAGRRRQYGMEIRTEPKAMTVCRHGVTKNAFMPQFACSWLSVGYAASPKDCCAAPHAPCRAAMSQLRPRHDAIRSDVYDGPQAVCHEGYRPGELRKDGCDEPLVAGPTTASAMTVAVVFAGAN